MTPDGFDKVFYGHMAAEQQGFRSRSQWKKKEAESFPRVQFPLLSW